MTTLMANASPRGGARIIGAVYLLYFVTAILAGFFQRGLIISGDAAATTNNILAHEALFRLGLATGLISTACYIAVTALLYELFWSVNSSLSLVAAFFSLVGCAIQAFGSLFQLAPLVVLRGNPYLSDIKIEQSRALTLVFLEMHAQAVNICLVFFGIYCLLIGYLIFRSAFLPRLLGVLMAFAGLGWLSFLSPPLANTLSPHILVLGFIAELSLCLWLLVMGVNAQRWLEQAGERQAG